MHTGQQDERAPRGWTGPNRRLWNAVRAGRWLELAGRVREGTDPHEVVTADAIRTVLTSGVGPEGDRRLRLRGARITGRLELRGVECGAALILIDCVFTEPVNLTGAELPELAMVGCRAPELRLGWLTTAGSVRVVECEVDGPVLMTEARVGRRLDLSGSRFGEFSAINLTVGGDLDARQLTSGWCQLTGANVAGRIRLIDATLGDAIRALWLTGATSGGDLDLYRVHARGLVNLRTANVGGRIVLDRARIEGTPPIEGNDAYVHGRPGLDAIVAEGLSTRGDLSLRYATVDGEVRLTTAQIGGTCNVSGSQLNNPGGRALEADRSAIGSGLLALDGFSTKGSVVLRDARIDGPVLMSRGTIDAPTDRAFNASGLTSTGGFLANNYTFRGQVRLTHAQIGGPFDLTGTELIASTGRELSALTGDAEGLALAGMGMVVNGEVRAAGLTVTGTVDLSTSRISGLLRMSGARFTDAATPGSGSLILSAATLASGAELDGVDIAGHLDLRVAKVTDHVRLADAYLRGADGRSLRATGLRAAQLRFRLAEPPGGRIGLAGATIDVLADHATSWPITLEIPPEDGRAVVLDGFTYQRLESTLDVHERLAWLDRATPTFEPQPYEQLASCYRQMGREPEARRVLREKTRRQHAAAGRFGRIWGWIQQVAVGYGYQPGRAVGWFLGLAHRRLALVLPGPLPAVRPGRRLPDQGRRAPRLGRRALHARPADPRGRHRPRPGLGPGRLGQGRRRGADGRRLGAGHHAGRRRRPRPQPRLSPPTAGRPPSRGLRFAALRALGDIFSVIAEKMSPKGAKGCVRRRRRGRVGVRRRAVWPRPGRVRPGSSGRRAAPRARAASRRARLIVPPSTSNSRPVTCRDSALPSQTTSGATFSGAIASNPSTGAAMVSANTVSVIRVRAAGAIALTVTPYRSSSAAATTVSAAIPALAAA